MNRIWKCTVASASIAAMMLAAHGAWAASPNATADGSTFQVRVTANRLTVDGSGASVRDFARELAAKAPIDIKLQDPKLGDKPIAIRFADMPLRDGIASVLQPFNYSHFSDPQTGRETYVVMSLVVEPVRAKTAEGASEPPKTVAVAVEKTIAPTSSTAKSLDELRAVKAATIKAPYQDQAEIEREYKREREERLVRALDVLKSNSMTSDLQSQALYEVSGSNDPRALAALRDAAQDPRVATNSNAASAVARSVWRYAAQSEFGNPEANQLLTAMASNGAPAAREIAQAALRDMANYRTANGKP